MGGVVGIDFGFVGVKRVGEDINGVKEAEMVWKKLVEVRIVPSLEGIDDQLGVSINMKGAAPVPKLHSKINSQDGSFTLALV